MASALKADTQARNTVEPEAQGDSKYRAKNALVHPALVERCTTHCSLIHACVTQLAEYLASIQMVAGSIPVARSMFLESSSVGGTPDCYSGGRRFESFLSSQFKGKR